MKKIICLQIIMIALSGLYTQESKTLKTEYPYIIAQIIQTKSVEIPNKAKGKPSRFETRLQLIIFSAFDKKGKMIDPKYYGHPLYTGDTAILKYFKTDDYVKIISDPKIGAKVKSIRLILPATIVMDPETQLFRIKTAYTGRDDIEAKVPKIFLDLDDSTMGVSLADKLAAIHSGAKGTYRIWLEGSWGTVFSGPDDFTDEWNSMTEEERSQKIWPFTVRNIYKSISSPEQNY